MAGLQLQIGSTVLTLPWGYEWSFKTSVDLALEWDQMTSGIWRAWDTGTDRDRYTASLPWRVMESNAALVQALIESAQGIPGTLLPLEPGLMPFGPFVDLTSPVAVRVTAYAPQSRSLASKDWSIQLQIALDPAPAVQGILSIPANSWQVADFAAVANVAPVLDPGWSVEQAEVGYLALAPVPTAYQCSMTVTMRDTAFQRVLASLLAGRGAPVVIPASQNPWGPGVLGTLSGGDHSAIPKAWSWSQVAPHLYAFSLTAARIA